MAPALIETPQDSGAEKIYVKTQLQDGYKEAFAQGPKTTNWDNELKGVGKHPPAKYPHYLPVWDNEKDLPNQKYPPNQPFEAYEHGKDADPSFQNLLKGATSVEDLTANIGAEVKGIQLSKLDKAGKDELALFVAQKKVVGMNCYSLHINIRILTQSISFPRPRLCRPTNSRSSGLCRVLRSLAHPPCLRRTKGLPQGPPGPQICCRHNRQRLLRGAHQQHNLAQ